MLTTVLFLFLLFLVPYRLYDSVQLVYFLHPFHQVDPHFLSRDWYVTQTPNPHPFFGFLIAFLKSHTHLPSSLFLIHVLEFFLLVVGVSRLTKLFSEDRRTLPLVFCLLLFYFSMGLGQSDLYSGIVRPTDLGILFYLFSLGAMFRERILQTWVFLGFSALFHIQTGTEGLLILMMLWIFQGRRWNVRRMVGGFLVFLLIASPNLLPILRNFLAGESSVSPEIFNLLFNFRGPHHYRASTFELSHVFRVLFPLVFLWVREKKRGKKDAAVLARPYVTLLVSLCFLAAISTEWLPLPWIGRAYLFGLSPFLLLLGLVFLARTLLQELDENNLRSRFLVGITLVILFLERDSRLFIPLSLTLAWAWVCRKKKWPLAALGLVCFLLFLVTDRGWDLLINAGLVLVLTLLLKIKPERLIPQAILGFLVLGVPALTFHFISPERSSFHPLEVRPRPPILQNNPALEEAVQWIRNNTSQDALLLSPPYLDGIRFFAQRAIVVDFHALPYGGKEIQEWKRRLEEVTQLEGLERWVSDTDSTEPQRVWLRKGYLGLRAMDVEKIAQRYGVDYFLTESSFPERKRLTSQGHTIVFQNSSYLVFRLKSDL